jgi:leader peptidase (prepilin peptidase)/N-methyltransferase
MNTLMYLSPLWVFIIFAIALSYIDAKRHILPNRLVLASLTAILATEIGLVTISQDITKFSESVLVGLETLLVYICLLVVSRGKLGMGDVKYSFVTGLVMGWVAPQMWLVCIWLAFTLASLWVLVTARQVHRTRHSHIAFGPFMSIAVAICAVAGQINS